MGVGGGDIEVRAIPTSAFSNFTCLGLRIKKHRMPLLVKHRFLPLRNMEYNYRAKFLIDYFEVHVEIASVMMKK